MAESADCEQKNWFWCPSLAMVTSTRKNYSENLQKSYKQQSINHTDGSSKCHNFLLPVHVEIQV